MRVRGTGRPLARADLWLALAGRLRLSRDPGGRARRQPRLPRDRPGREPARRTRPDDSRLRRVRGRRRRRRPRSARPTSRSSTSSSASAPTRPRSPPASAPTTADCNPLTADRRRPARRPGREREPAPRPRTTTRSSRCSMISGVRADTAWKSSTRPGNDRACPATRGRDRDPRHRRSLAGRATCGTRSRSTRTSCPSRRRPGDPSRAAAAARCAAAVRRRRRRRLQRPRLPLRLPGRPSPTATSEADGVLDPSDLIAEFSDGIDDDPGGNGYVDDIAGWDFFDDDNDPFDASSCCSANGHGTGRAKEAAAQTNNGQSTGPNNETGNAGGDAGMCPECQIMPLRVWDTFVVPIDNYAMGVVYAAQQRGRGGRGRRRRPRQHPVRPQGLRVRRRAGAGADDGLLRHQQRQPQLPDQLQRGDLRRRARSPTPRRTTPAPGPGGLGPVDLPTRSRAAARVRGGLRRSCSAAARRRRRRAGIGHPDRLQPLDHELLPQLEPDPVRRQGRHRPDGRAPARRTPARPRAPRA